MRALELLAPAKNLACGMAAIDHGADAVYIGAPHFGARAAAGNSIEDIRSLCNYAHPFGARVYVTLNTIIYDDELDDVRSTLVELAEAGADAVLVQDMAVLQMMGDLPMAVHASTQTDNRTPEKVRWLRDCGFTRTVLARELSIGEIARIHQDVPDMELEVFVHGALCVSYSGLCYASQHCFGRSANRGECAQFCRMRFSLVDADNHEIVRDRYLLSLKDMNQSDHLLELIEAGATSFKIEGRLKEEPYVKNVTAAYSQRLNAIIRQHPDKYCRASKGQCEYTFKPDLRKTFNRGYTTYFLNGRKPDIASFDTPKAMGEFVGMVKEIRRDSFNVAGVSSFSNGDGLCFLNDDNQLEGFRANRVAGNRIYPYKMPAGLRAGIPLYRNSDQDFDRLLSKSSAVRKIPVTMAISAFDDDGFAPGFQLKISDGQRTHAVCIHTEHQYAVKSQREQIVKELSKLGNTPYRCERVDIPDDFDYFIPASRLSELRRIAVNTFQETNGKTDKQGAASVVSPHGSDAIPSYPFTYLYNVSNRKAQQFYGMQDLTAFELKGGDGPLMQCRHCLRYSLGCCVKHGGRRPEWREPLSLVLGDGRRFRLEFDCTHCQMNVYRG